uniref:ATP-dependent RNA helicase DDX20 n=1 Tax=Ascaris suum TaxID=6253 RepID=F1KVJ5_ASCSU
MEFVEVIDIERTADVKSSGNFASLMLARSSVDALTKAGFIYPSPVQAAAIPIGLMGFDMLVQAKSGTGKTLVFALMALEGLNAQRRQPQVMIIAPTREIAMQIAVTVRRLAPPVIHVGVFVGGGRSVADDIKEIRKGVHIAVGTTGRLCQLVNDDLLPTNHVHLFVLDEADKLMEENFQKDINFLFSSLPNNKQMAVFSATYPGDLDETLARYMKKAHLIRLNAEDVQLLGIKQYVAMSYSEDGPTSLHRLLSSITFTQCLVFANDQQKCERIVSTLHSNGLDAELISGAMEQSDRNRVMKRLKNYQLKVLVSTDLTARGIDAENVNVVVNVGCPLSAEIYLHRIGRAGRFGGYGVSITILSMGKDVKRFTEIMKQANLKVKLLHLMKEYPRDLCQNQLFYESSSDFKPVKKKRPCDGDMSSRNSCLNSPPAEEDDDELEAPYKECISNSVLSSEMLRKIRRTEAARQQKAKCRAEELSKTTTNDSKSIVENSVSSLVVDSTETKTNAEAKASEGRELQFTHEPTTECVASSSDVSVAVEKNVPDMQQVGDVTAVVLDRSYATLASVNPPLDSSSGNQSDLFSTIADQQESAFRRPSVKDKKRVILRDDMLKIRDSFSASQWWKYACFKYGSALNDEPFMQKRLDQQTPTTSTAKIPSSGGGICGGKSATQISNRIVYSRERLIAIRESRCAQEWSLWAERKWNTKEDPFQMDDQLRVPFTQQIRIRREREKRERDAVQAARREAKALEASKRSNLLFASSRYPFHIEMSATFDDYMRDFYKAYKENETKVSSGRRQGPVVTLLRRPQEYANAVSQSAAYLNSVKSSFWSQLKISVGAVKEESSSAEEHQMPKVDCATQTDVPSEENDVEDVQMQKTDSSNLGFARSTCNINSTPDDQRARSILEKSCEMHSELLNNYYYYLNYYTNKYYDRNRSSK